MNGILYDSRWIGDHGIGRFAREIGMRLKGAPLGGALVSPSGPFDLPYSTLRVVSRPQSRFFSPGYNVPLLGLNRYAFTLHDLNHLDVAENSSHLKRFYYDFVLKRACQRAACVLTVSEFSKRRILEWSGANERRIINVGNGVSESFHYGVKPAVTDFRYFFCVSNRKAHKNESRLLKAFSAAAVPEDIRLVFTGKADSALQDVINSLPNLKNRVLFVGRISESDLSGWYRGALALVFPSLYEGFGLPVIEAMACGTPVVTSNTTSLPEVAGDAALLVDPLDVPSIAVAMEKLSLDGALRDTLSSKGLERAKLFSWDVVSNRVKTALANAFPDLDWE